VMSGKQGGRFLHASHFPLLLGYDYSGLVMRHGFRSVGF